jgi:hypothetical protein
MFVVLALISFPVRAGFHFEAPSCELLVGLQLALFSFRNYSHIVLFALFAVLSRLQFRGSNANMWAFVATIVMGVLVELAEGVSGDGHCRMRDILPDAAGAVTGLLIFAAGKKMWRAHDGGRHESPA